jgi:hypothetical protein|nr:MAG TPA: hypothetical protein [Caudoviricetes sp.]
MIKKYCDICGKEASTNKYCLPVKKDTYARDRYGNPLIKTKTIGSEEKDVCLNCARKIQFLIGCVLPMMDEDTSIIFESPKSGKSFRIEHIGV